MFTLLAKMGGKKSNIYSMTLYDPRPPSDNVNLVPGEICRLDAAHYTEVIPCNHYSEEGPAA